ncbi:Mu transposase C-terminal domain-containing protein [Loktanella sp. 3ANDIMAR09]|uniref:Mu transposase C-terminal domain-containing protein n=1 Tax=Loktanella sp. 3ANDIMAR09 TaxID=1225657 RepID=UPI0006F5FF2A|nr:Mu transposase C-terminal domain-containing protein [Loktanella sp. 3ANDIMAR09]
MKEWMTAAEIAAMGLEGLPKSTQKITARARQDEWRKLGPNLARKRAGRGGGWEYHVTCLPPAALADWELRRERALTPAAPKPPALKREADPVTTLSGRRRRVMEARAQVLMEVQRRVITEGKSQRQAILSLIADFKSDTALPEHQRVLSAPLFDACGDANDKGRRSLSRPAVYRWIKEQCEGGVAALAPQNTRPASADDAWPWLPRLLRFYCRPQKPALKKAHADLLKSGLVNEPVSYAQCKRAIASLQGTERYLDAHRGREGANALKARMAFKRRDTSMLDPTAVYIADGKLFDAEIAHPVHGQPFKPEITSILDVATRRCVGWSLSLAENTDAVADAVRMAVTDCGIPAIFYSDNGPGYRNARMDGPVHGLCARLGTTTSHSLPYNSQARGIIERFNGSVWNPFAQEFDTYLGAPMDREAANVMHRATRRDIREVGTSHRVCGWELFMERAAAVVAAYNDAPHDALRVRDRATGRWIARSPNQAWAEAEAAGFAPFVPTAVEIDDLFRPHMERTARRGEVQFLSNIYFHPDLQPYDGLKVLVGYDIHDAQRVWVRSLGDDGEMGGLICVAEYAGNSTHYMPRPMVEAAQERRLKGQRQRLAVKMQAVEDAARAPLFIEHAAPEETLPEVLPPAAEPVRVRPRVVERTPDPDDEVISEDLLLSADLLSGRMEMTEGRYELMVRFLRFGVGDNLMKHAGYDPEALRAKMRTFKEQSGVPPP